VLPRNGEEMAIRTPISGAASLRRNRDTFGTFSEGILKRWPHETWMMQSRELSLLRLSVVPGLQDEIFSRGLFRLKVRASEPDRQRDALLR
jgi:hypothetical protein